MKNIEVKFFLLIFILSIPFWILGSFVDLKNIIPINLPISALMLFCPLMASIILTKKEKPVNGLKPLFSRVLDYKKASFFYNLTSIFMIPTLMLGTYILMCFISITIPSPNIHLLDIFILSILFFIGAICEEVGWTGFITDPLQDKVGAIKTSLIIGFIWAIWHIIPYTQAHRSVMWIFWQCLSTIFLRFIILWLYNNTNKSLFIAILAHTSINISEFLFPNYGSHYDPFYFDILLFITVMITTFFSTLKKLKVVKLK